MAQSSTFNKMYEDVLKHIDEASRRAPVIKPAPVVTKTRVDVKPGLSLHYSNSQIPPPSPPPATTTIVRKTKKPVVKKEESDDDDVSSGFLAPDGSEDRQIMARSRYYNEKNEDGMDVESDDDDDDDNDDESESDEDKVAANERALFKGTNFRYDKTDFVRGEEGTDGDNDSEDEDFQKPQDSSSDSDSSSLEDGEIKVDEEEVALIKGDLPSIKALADPKLEPRKTARSAAKPLMSDSSEEGGDNDVFQMVPKVNIKMGIMRDFKRLPEPLNLPAHLHVSEPTVPIDSFFELAACFTHTRLHAALHQNVYVALTNNMVRGQPLPPSTPGSKNSNMLLQKALNTLAVQKDDKRLDDILMS